MDTGAAQAAPAGIDSEVVPLGMAEDTKIGDVVSFGLIGGMRVRLDEVVSKLPGLARVMRPLIAGGKKITRVREVLQRSAGKVRRIDKEVPEVRRGNWRRKEGNDGDELRPDRAREGVQNWIGRANRLRGQIGRAEDEIGRLQRMNDELFVRGEAEIVGLREVNHELRREAHELRDRLNAIGAEIGSPRAQRLAPGGPINGSPGGGYQRRYDFGAEGLGGGRTNW